MTRKNNSKKSKRLLALDVLRGATMMLMITVNTPGSWSYVYAPFEHAKWHGLTLTDLVFPFFLWMVGVSMWFSLGKKSGQSDGQKIKRIWKRAFKIFLIGTLLRAAPFVGIAFGKFRFLGVLHRIALAYGIAGTMVVKLSQKQLVISSIIILFGYWGVMFYFGGTDPYGIENNVVRWLDLKVLGANHMWHGHGLAFDPEGLLSTLPSIVTVLLGYFAARQLKKQKDLQKAVNQLFVNGVIGLTAGLLWGNFFPVNKALWTSSYVLLTAGIAAIVLALLLWIIDIKGWRKWTLPFQIFGKNAILGYVLASGISKMMYRTKWTNGAEQEWTAYSWIYKKIFVPIFGNMNGSLAFALTLVAFVGVILWIFWRKKIFLKV